MCVLVIAEHDNACLKAATLHTVSAANACGADVHVLVAGHDCHPVAAAAAGVAGVSRVLLADAPHLGDGLAENLAAQILALAGGYSHILAPATSSGKNVLPRVAALLDVAQISDVTRVLAPDTFERPIYAGNVIATVQSSDPIKVLTVRTTAFDAAGAATAGGAGGAFDSTAADASPAAVRIALVPVAPDTGRSRFVSRETSTSERPELTAAKIVVSGGRGLGSAENYRTLMEPLADKLGAALGASRAAVDAGFVPNDYQVGQTGKIIAPQLYVAVGISGAIQHLAGMKESKVIVAINKDAEAPIFAVADYGLVADLFVAVPELLAELS